MIIKPSCGMSIEEAKKILSYAIEYGFLCGSRKFGLNADDSDYDYIVKYNEASEIVNVNSLRALNMLREYNSRSKFPTLGLTLTTDKKKFNILIPLTDEEYNAWIVATKEFCRLLEDKTFKEIAKDKTTRVAIFERLREIYGIPNKDKGM